jgi:GTPase-associated protein 1, N-terminal domain type 2/GTPase-associated protein 1, middle domain
MPTLNALQHIFSSVERGYFAQQGRGFQTVAVTPELAETEDLRVLEEAAFYAVSRERRQSGELPIKETFFRLPSGRFAIGRTINLGTDSLGREGNYLTHHLVFSRDDLLAAGAQTLNLLDATPPVTADTDLTPRELPSLFLEVASVDENLHRLARDSRELLANLVAAVDGGKKTVLLIGDEVRSRAILKMLCAALATEERLRLTFSTHFYESHQLRHLFAVVTVRSRAEAPAQQQDYTVFDLNDGLIRTSPTSAYTDWLADCLCDGRWEEINALNAMLDKLRSRQDGHQGGNYIPTGTRACAALWERAGTDIAQALIGDVRLVFKFLRRLSSPRPLADLLLAAASPSKLCGESTSPRMVGACLLALRSTATRKKWRAWIQHWKDDPVLVSFLPKGRPWWQVWN